MTIFYIYIIQNLINKKIYIGQTKNKNDRWRQHKYDCFIRQSKNRLYHSIRKYGESNFKYFVFAQYDEKEIDEAEIFWIDFFKSYDDCIGYNIELGGSINKIVSISTRQKLSIARKNKTHTEYSKQKISLSKIGSIHSDETKSKMSVAHTGKLHSQITKNLISKSHIGICILHTEESKQKMSMQRQGDKNIRAKLKDSDIIIILNMIKNGESYKDISMKFNVSYSTISKIANGLSWKHIIRN